MKPTADHATNYAMLLGLAREDYHRRLEPSKMRRERLQQDLDAAKVALAVKPWSRRWWGYIRRPYLDHKLDAVIQITIIAFMLACSAVFWVKAMPDVCGSLIVAAVIAAIAYPLIGRDEIRTDIKRLTADLATYKESKQESISRYLGDRLVPRHCRTCTIAADGTRVYDPPLRLAFCHSEADLRELFWFGHEEAQDMAKHFGHTPELDLVITHSKAYAERMERHLWHIGNVMVNIVALGRQAWQGGRLDYASEHNASYLSVALEVLDFHERLETLWKFNNLHIGDVDLEETLNSKEWSAIEARAAELTASSQV